MKRKTEYQVWINFIDSTYWDDGSRYTNRKTTFKKRNEALAFIETVQKEGFQYKGQNSNGHTTVDKDDITLIKVTESVLEF